MRQTQPWNPLESRATKQPDNRVAIDYAELFSTPQGQRVLDDMTSAANKPGVNNTDIDPNLCVWLIARQNLLTYIHGKVDAGLTAKNNP
jgi:hypothetical protein